MNKVLFILPFIFISLLIAIWSGWIRIGWALPLTGASAHHGAVMVGSFLSTLIFLERAVTFKKSWVLLLPFVNGISIIFFLRDEPLVAQGLLIAGSIGFFIMCGYFIFKYEELYYYIFLMGAFCLAGGNIILFKTHFYPNAVNWWMGFLMFTIVAERLELSRFLPLALWKRNLLVMTLFILLISLFLPFHMYGNILFAVALVLTAGWLLKYDMAWLSLKVKGQHRYSASLLITGYLWLIVTAALLIFGDRLPFIYDAALHSFFIGFVFSMIFSHAPIILPAVLKIPIKIYRPVLYVWFFLLQLSLVFRIIADSKADIPLRRISGVTNGMVILLFFVTVIIIVFLEFSKRNSALKS